MFKKTKSSLAVTLSVAMLATMVTIPKVASAATGTQISGQDRYQTALKIVEDGWKTSESAVIARGDDLADALAAAPLAFAKGKAPILLTKTNEIPAGVLQEIKDLGVKNLYIVGGVGAVSQKVQDQLATAGVTVTRVNGADRYATSLAIAKEAFGTTPADVVIANGLAYADALSVSSIAASKGMPILLVGKTLSAEQSSYIAGKTVYAVGGEGVLNTDVVSVAKAERISGADRYATNAAILSKFEFDYSKLYLAKGTPANLVDALAGSALAALTNSPIVLVDGTNKLSSSLEKVLIDKIKDDSAIVRLGGTVSQAAADAVEATKTGVNVGEVKVSSVAAISANSFKVTFSSKPADISKVVFEVSRTTSPLTVTTSWNAAQTEATLSTVANLPEAEYSIKVMNGTTDLGTSKVAISQQKIAKINVTSNKLGVVTDKDSKQTGYATYNVIDQYGVDVTNGSLANNIQWNTGVGSITARKGLITVNPSSTINLMTFTSGVVITANDTNTGVATTSTLTVTSQVGTLSDIKLNSISNADGKELTAGDSTNLFYIDFTATDVSGNVTTNYDLIRKGLIYKTSDGGQFLNTSNNDVTAEVKQDPKDSNKAVIEVRSTQNRTQIDMDVIITAMTWTGKNSQLTTKLKKQSEVFKLTLSAPAEDIASGESKIIPYTAVDQNGVAMTKYEDLSDITFSGINATRGTNGELLLKNKPVTNTNTSSITQVLSASVPNSTNGYSSITVNIQKKAEADMLYLDSEILNTIMQSSFNGQAAAEQTIDFGYDNGGLEIKDQYGRVIDMDDQTDVVGTNYKVVPRTSDASVIAVSGFAQSGQKNISIVAGAVGTATVSFDLIDMSSGKVLDTKSQTLSVIKNSDIKGYMIDQLTDPLFVNYTKGTTITDAHYNYDANPAVYGKTSTGAKVVLRGTPILGANVSNSDFTVYVGKNGGVAPDEVEVGANVLADAAKTGSTAILTVSVLGYDSDDNTQKTVYTVKTPISSSTVDPVASNLKVSYDTSITGVTESDDVVTIDLGADQSEIGLVAGNYVTRYDSMGMDGKHASIYFRAYDQYSTKSTTVSQIQTVGSTTSGFAVDLNGKITSAATQPGTVTLSAVTNNGLVKTVKLNFVRTGSVTPVTPVAPVVTAEDTTNVITGITTAMEYAIDGATTYTKYVATAAPDLSGNKTVKVRVAAVGINPVSADTTLTFTTNVAPTEFVQSATYTTGAFGNSTVIKVLDSSKVTGVKLDNVDLTKDVKYLIEDATTITVLTTSKPADKAIVLVKADGNVEVIGVK